MTKEQRADELLCAAKHWQNGEDRVAESEEMQDRTDYACDLVDIDWESLPRWLTVCASAALSEVCHGLGFEIEDAP